MSAPGWRIRVATDADRGKLAAFRCADPKVGWQLEVERFIQNRLLDWAFEPRAAQDEPRVLLVLHKQTQDLVGVAAHERLMLRAPDATTFEGTKLEVIAVAVPWQGQLLGTTERASDVVMSAAMTDIRARVPPRSPRIVASVHEENVRSLALCRRHGFTTDLERVDPAYRRLVA